MEATVHDGWKLIGGKADVDRNSVVGLTGPGSGS